MLGSLVCWLLSVSIGIVTGAFSNVTRREHATPGILGGVSLWTVDLTLRMKSTVIASN